MSAETTWDAEPDCDSALAWAYRYAHKGWAVIAVWSAGEGRCECGHPHDGTDGLPPSSIGKHPVRGLSWTDASTDIAVIETWFTDTEHSIAIVPALSGLDAVDVDGPAGEAELVALEAEHGALPPTLTDRSGRQDGGRHLIFATDQAPPSKSLAEHIDTRGASGYVIVAPSMHQSGRRYEWQNWPTAPAPLPAWIVDTLQPQPASSVDADVEPLPDPVPAWLARWFAEKPVDGTRHRRHYALVARCVELGLSNGQILTAVQHHSPSSDKFGRRLKAETLRVLGKVAHLRDQGDAERDAERGDPDHLRTDVGNAERLVDEHGHRFRYVPAWSSWLHWDGRRWTRDSAGLIVEAAKATARRMVREAAEVVDPDERKPVMSWALKSESAQRIDAMIRLARSAPGIPVEPDQLDADVWMLNVTNGTINLRTGKLLEHNPARLCTKITTTAYRSEATAPRWDEFLNTVLPDVDVKEFVARTIGYSLTGDVSEQKLFLAHGTGANGKTTLLDAVATVMGDYASQAEPDLLMARSEPHPTGVARLQGARLVIASESDDGRRLAEGVVKRLTGGDRITARFMRADFFEFTPSHKLWLMTNHKPKITGTDHAIWRRLRLVPFTVTVADEDQDPHLPQALAAEAEGILAWAVQGCLRWHSDGLTEPLAVQLATSAYKFEQDTLGEFLSDVCDLSNTETMTPAGELYQAYRTWCDENGERPASQKRLGQVLTERGLDRVKHGPQRRWHWLGVRLDTAKVNP